MIENQTSNVDKSQIEAVKKRIRQILAELKALAKAPDVTDQFFLEQLASRTIESTGAAGVTIWQVGEEGAVSVVHEVGSTSNNANLNAEQMTMHERLVRTVVASSRPTLIEPQAQDQSTGDIINPLAFLLLLKPLNDPSLQCSYVIELFQRPDIAAAARTGYMRYLEQIGEIFSSWQARNQLRFQSTQQSQQEQTLDFVRSIHSSLDPTEVAYAAANDGRLLAGCDRLSILKFDGRQCKVLSVSGQDDFDNRSNVVKKQEELTTLVCKTQQPLWLIGQSGDLPRATKDLVDDYLNESHSRTLGVLPLFDGKGQVDLDVELEDDPEPSMPTGAMIVEWFGQDMTEMQASANIEVLSDHIGRALGNANEYKSIFLMPVWRTIGKWKWLISAKTLPKTIAASAIALLLLLFFCFFPWTFDMRVQGVLEPVKKQNVYALTEGVVSKVYVHHGQLVTKGDPLVDLRDDKLEAELISARGQLKVTEQQINTERTQALMARQAQNYEAEQLASNNLTAAVERSTSLRKQIAALELREAQLNIVSPITGTVVSWDPVRQLTERPVRPEDIVLVIANVGEDSKWHLELFIPERKYGHVAGDGTGKDREVTFFATTNPNKTYKARIVEVEDHSGEHETYGSCVRAFAVFEDGKKPKDLYVGAGITAKVHCGRAPAGYAWFHELFEFVQSRLLF